MRTIVMGTYYRTLMGDRYHKEIGECESYRSGVLDKIEDNKDKIHLKLAKKEVWETFTLEYSRVQANVNIDYLIYNRYLASIRVGTEDHQDFLILTKQTTIEEICKKLDFGAKLIKVRRWSPSYAPNRFEFALAWKVEDFFRTDTYAYEQAPILWNRATEYFDTQDALVIDYPKIEQPYIFVDNLDGCYIIPPLVMAVSDNWADKRYNYPLILTSNKDVARETMRNILSKYDDETIGKILQDSGYYDRYNNRSDIKRLIGSLFKVLFVQ